MLLRMSPPNFMTLCLSGAKLHGKIEISRLAPQTVAKFLGKHRQVCRQVATFYRQVAKFFRQAL